MYDNSETSSPLNLSSIWVLRKSLFLIEHLNLSGVYARLVDMCYGHHEDMCHNKNGLCAQNVGQPF